MRSALFTPSSERTLVQSTISLRHPVMRSAALIVFAAFVWEICPAGRSAAAAETPCWPRFHGPNGDNHSPDTGLLKK